VLLNICGESTCAGVKDTRAFIIDLAKKFKALILTVEHRYYGESMPFPKEETLKLEKLKYLTIDQALSDLIYFVNYIKQN